MRASAFRVADRIRILALKEVETHFFDEFEQILNKSPATSVVAVQNLEPLILLCGSRIVSWTTKLHLTLHLHWGE